jgi:hypothetical protein
VLAADRFHVAPWELLAKGQAWVELALVALNAERQAEREIQRREQRRQKMARRQGGR